jgi:MtrB/PioB family decaheme-associated outer membrane protein
MRSALWAVLALGLALPAVAQEPAPSPSPSPSPIPLPPTPPEPPTPGTPVEAAVRSETAGSPALPSGFNVRRIDFGLAGVETDTNSSKFREYRAVPTGVVLPYLRFAGEDAFPYDVAAWNVLQEDARYRVEAAPGSFFVLAEFVKVPHRFGNDARSLLEDTGRGVLSFSDTFQQTFQNAIQQQFAVRPANVNFAFLNGLVGPSLASATPFDLKLMRERGHLEFGWGGDRPIDVRLSYSHEKRRGNRGSGTAFGFGNVVETPEPIDYRTEDIGLSAEWDRSWGLLRGAVNFNRFSNSLQVQTFDNPFRAVASTDASAYQAPGSASINGPAFGRLALPPDNQSVTGIVGGLWRFAKRSRVSADVSLGQWAQDEPFIPFTSNTAITTPIRASELSSLPTSSLDGKLRVVSGNAALTTGPWDGFTFSLRARRYDMDNKTPRVEFEEGYVRFDAAFEDIPRISVPYGYTNDKLQATASYDFGKASLEAGYRFEAMDRTFRETERTTQNMLSGSLRVRPIDWAVLRATVERGSRDFDHYDAEESEDASFLNPGPPANLTILRRYDQAAKDTTRVSGQVQVSPWGSSSFGLTYVRAKDDFKDLSHGLIDAKNEAFTADADYTPSDRLSVFAFYTREDIRSFQRGRQSAATLSTNPLDDWTADVRDKVDSVGGGGTVAVVKDRLDLSVSGTYQKVDGNNDLDSPAGGTPDVAFDIAQYDDTKIVSLNAELTYKLQGGWRLALGGWFEDYETQDAASSGLTNYLPGSFFLAGNDGNYRAHVIYARASYSW